MRDPDAVFAAPGVRDLLDLRRPVALLTVAVLHFVPEEEDAAGLTERYRSRLAPGSLHVLTHATGDHDPGEASRILDVDRNTANPGTIRTRDQGAAGGQHRGLWAGVGRLR